MRILLIEDDEIIAERIKVGLERAHFSVDIATDGETGLQRAREGPYALLILDLMLPGRDGWRVCEALRLRRNPLPILMLTARGGVEDRVRGLNAGADDYLPKPFDFNELLARVRALLRRDQIHKSRVIQIADLEIDPATRQVRRGGRELLLTPREFTLLEALARNEGRALTREHILERVWGNDESYSNTVSFHVASLRKKIDAEHVVKLIHTVHGIGYALRGPESEAEP
jgi:two-component system, OmpR family, copper resistance phosphate regulon response regulator CusR